MKVPARNLQTNDLVGTGEEVVRVTVGLRTPRGKVEVVLFNPRNGRTRTSVWNASTEIGVKRYAEL